MPQFQSFRNLNNVYMNAKNISIADFNYSLPEERIARFPVEPRDHSRLLVYDGCSISDSYFYSLPLHLEPGTLMVMNNTRVIHARLLFYKSTGALIEVFLLEPFAPSDYEMAFSAKSNCSWLCLVGNSKKWKEGTLQLKIPNMGVTLSAVRSTDIPPTSDGSTVVRFEWDSPDFSFADILQSAGQLPIPPYLGRDTQQSDLISYQTVYSKIEGSVAAPTAGLHFTPDVLAACDARGIERQELTLHVGAGTFKPVKSATMGNHVMHTEHICVSRQLLERLLAHNCQVTAVGTTSVRTLESLYYMGLRAMKQVDISEQDLHVGQWEPYQQIEKHLPSAVESIQALLDRLVRFGSDYLHTSTQIIIEPGYKFHIVQQLITNFHQPQSTLLLLVSAFTQGHWREIYDHALAHDYRFLSYGDSSLIKMNH